MCVKGCVFWATDLACESFLCIACSVALVWFGCISPFRVLFQDRSVSGRGCPWPSWSPK